MKKEAIDAGWTEKGVMSLLQGFGVKKASEIKNKHYAMVQARIAEAATLATEEGEDDDNAFPGGAQGAN
jgi:hypothetical protein